MIDLPDDTARVNALLGGEVDAIDAVPYDQIPVLQGNGSMVVEDVESGAWRPLVMNMSKPPFDDTRVRQAFRLIANRHELVAQAYAGHGVIAPDLSQRYDRCALVDQVEREQDIEQAKALLTQAGRAGLTVELTTSPINAGVVEASAVFAQQAKAAGVDVQLRKVDPGTYFARYGSWTFGVDYWPDNPYWSQVEVGALPGAPLNPAHWDDAEYTALYKQGSGELDPGRRCQIEKDMQRILFERGAELVWGFANAVDAHSNKVTGYVKDRSGWSANRWRYNLVGFTA
jgi:peptide/nickel transport system substrate-binding protein